MEKSKSKTNQIETSKKLNRDHSSKQSKKVETSQQKVEKQVKIKQQLEKSKKVGKTKHTL